MDEDQTESANDTVGEIHIIFRGDSRMEVSSTLNLPEMNIALDQVKYALLKGDLTLENI